ncbi:MAG TPA: hypothetical protein PKI19_12460 [Elusimicrobiales bacterium]|nr:hypothetical protein [Elusimicrobiales bacterium]
MTTEQPQPPRKFYEVRRKDGKSFTVKNTPQIPDLAALLLDIKPVLFCNSEKEQLPYIESLAAFFGLKVLITDLGVPGFRNGAQSLVFLSKAPALLKRVPSLLLLKDDGRDPRHFYEWANQLLGYPLCCVKFRGLDREPPPADARKDLMHRIRRNTPGAGDYPFTLNTVLNYSSRLTSSEDDRRLQQMIRSQRLPFHMLQVLPWHPCSFDCGESLRAGARIWRFLETFVPDFALVLEQTLAHPVLYLNAWEFAILDGKTDGPGAARYRRVLEPQSLLPAAAARLFRAGDSLLIEGNSVNISKGGRRVGSLQYEEPLLLSFVGPPKSRAERASN